MFSFLKKKKMSYDYERPSKVAGVTFINKDGKQRQSNIKKYVKRGSELYVQRYEYEKGKYAFGLCAKEGKFNTLIGNFNERLADDFLNADKDTDFKVIVSDVTGGTKEKPTLGVNFKVLSTKKI